MGLFEKIFKKDKNLEEKKTVNSGEYNPINFSDYKFIPMNSKELESIRECADYIKKCMPLIVENLNSEHIFHPDNIIEFWDAWINPKDLQQFLVPLTEDQLMKKLAACLGIYIQDKYQLDWCYAGNMRTYQGGDMTVQSALIKEDSNVLFLPLHVLQYELLSKRGVLKNELKNLDELMEKLPKSKKLTFEEFIVHAKATGKSEDVLKVWNYVLNLKELHFLSVHVDNIQENRPFIGIVDGQPWWFVFTDKEKAIKFAKSDPKFQSKDGNMLVMSSPTDSSIQSILKSESNGIYGVRVNFCDKDINADFDAPISILRRIIQIIKNE